VCCHYIATKLKKICWNLIYMIPHLAFYRDVSCTVHTYVHIRISDYHYLYLTVSCLAEVNMHTHMPYYWRRNETTNTCNNCNILKLVCHQFASKIKFVRQIDIASKLRAIFVCVMAIICMHTVHMYVVSYFKSVLLHSSFLLVRLVQHPFNSKY